MNYEDLSLDNFASYLTPIMVIMLKSAGYQTGNNQCQAGSIPRTESLNIGLSLLHTTITRSVRIP